MFNSDKQRERASAKQKVRDRINAGFDRSKYKYIPEEKPLNYCDDNITQTVGIYVRVSTDDVRQTTSYELQKKYYEDFVQKHPNWKLYKIYADEGISGTSTTKREAFNEMIADAKAHKIDLIITKSVSRFARNVRDFLGAIRDLADLKPAVGVFFESEAIHSLNEDSQMALTFQSTMAEEESHTRSRSMESSLRMRLDIRMYNDTSDSSAFNMLAVMLFLLQDYYDYGPYTNTQDIIESNGTGDILWDKTINETFTLLSDNRPYYPELLTMKRITDDFDFFKRLHECILTRCTEELRDADLLDLFDIMGTDISDEQIKDFGDKEYVLDKIVKELNVQFNTRKQLLLKTLYAYIANSSALDDLDCFSMFGTNSFNLVWEAVCADVMDNQLQKPIGGIKLPVPLSPKYQGQRRKKLIELIDKPQWVGESPNGTFSKEAPDTLIPDLISIVNTGEEYQFIIFDAKYYNIQLEESKKLRGQPGIESITKQYLYQLAYQPFVNEHQITTVRNCFLMPTNGKEVVVKGTASLAMLSGLGLQDIQIRLLPAETMYRHYIENTKINIAELKL